MSYFYSILVCIYSTSCEVSSDVRVDQKQLSLTPLFPEVFIMHVVVFWFMAPSSLIVIAEVSEEHIACSFREKCLMYSVALPQQQGEGLRVTALVRRKKCSEGNVNGDWTLLTNRRKCVNSTLGRLLCVSVGEYFDPEDGCSMCDRNIIVHNHTV